MHSGRIEGVLFLSTKKQERGLKANLHLLVIVFINNMQNIKKQIKQTPYLEEDNGLIYNADCLDIMKQMPDKCIDLVLTDPPYGTTHCDWDKMIDFELYWKEIKRISKNNAPIIMTAREPFTSLLVNSNINNYRHKWVWNKKLSGNFLLAKYMPLQIDEDVIVFSFNTPLNYYPIMRKGKLRLKKMSVDAEQFDSIKNKKNRKDYFYDEYYPINILDIPNTNRKEIYHPTGKPVLLFEYLVKTYSKDNNVILEPFLGSGTTAVACQNLNRKYIGIELEEKYCEIAKQRLKQKTLF